MILLSSPLKMTPGNHGKCNLSLEIEIVTTKIVNSKSLKKICRQLLSTMNALNQVTFIINISTVTRFNIPKHAQVFLDCPLRKIKCRFLLKVFYSTTM